MSPIHKLHPRFVETVQEEGMHPDGGNLYLQVSESGAKSWIFRYHVKGRGDRKMGLGSLHTYGLAEARELARQCRQQRKDGIDPIEARDAAKLAQELQAAKQVTFRICAEEWIERNSPKWVPGTKSRHVRRLKVFIDPVLGHLPVSAINVDLCEKVLEPIWESMPTTGRKTQLQLEGILDLAMARGYREGNNPANMKGPLGLRLKPYTHIPTHYRALPHEKIGAFIAQLRTVINKRTGKRPVTAYAEEFLILTAVRTSQMTGLPWTEIDWNNKVWICPRHKVRKKTKEPHVIPLSTAAMAILNKMREQQIAWWGKTHEYVFVHGPNDPFGHAGKRVTQSGLWEFLQTTLNRPDLTSHGFRTTFKSWADDNDYPDQDSERALGHVVGSGMRQLYGRLATRHEPRRQMMEAWAQYCDHSEPLEAKVIPIRSATQA
jgi:integrase